MRLKKRLVLLEEFQAGVSSSNNKTASPVSKSVDTVETSATATKSSAEARAEVINDVDAILTNLEKLSAQIAEEVELQLENLDTYELLNESFMEEMMKQFKSMKAYAKLKGAYANIRQNKLDLEVEKEDAIAKFDAVSEEKKEQMLAKIKEKFAAKKKEITASDIPSEQKTLQRKKIDEVWKQQQAAIDKKLDAQLANDKAKLDAAYNQKITAAGKTLTEFEAENKIESDFLSKQWDASKVKIDGEQDLAHIDAKFQAKQKYDESDDPEAAKRAKEKLDKMAADQQKEQKEAAAKAAENLAKAQEEADRRAQEGDEKTKAANEKMKTYYASVQDLLGALNSQDVNDYDDDAKKEIALKKKAHSAAFKAMSGNVFVDGGVAETKEEGEEMLTSMKEQVDEALADFKGVLDAMKDVKTDTEKAVEAAEAAENEAKNALDLIDKNEDPEGYKVEQKKYFEAQIVTQQAKKADAEANNEDTAKFDTKIAELQQKISDLENTGGEPAQEAQSAEQVAQAELGDEFSNYTKVENPDEEETVTNDAGEEVTRKKWMNAKTFKGKDAEGNDTEETAIYALPNTGESAPVASGSNVSESFGFQTASVADKFRMLM
jgi:hypothetical protein